MVHLGPGPLGLVAAGGAMGTAARWAITVIAGERGAYLLATLLINVIGALLLSVLIEALALRGSDGGHRRAARLLLGTGFLGGFTTYSALALDIDVALRNGDVPLAVTYAGGTVLVGLVASLLGIAAVRAVVRR